MVWGIHPTDYQNSSLLLYYAYSHRLITHHQYSMIIPVDFTHVVRYATYRVVIFLTIPFIGIFLFNNDERATFSFNPISHFFKRLMSCG